ncbi:hypothetical protein F5880DRAFT_1605166 [Lentinula raphanica]|nr:hypothetical protein F5880DRAFT_1605166 [Lentinula raphanica]
MATTVAPLHSTMGALLIGVLISGGLWGISCSQTYLYFSAFYHHDTVRLKLLVILIFVFDTAHQVMLSHSIYMYLVSNFGNLNYLGTVTWSMIVMVLLSALIAVMYQLFMCWRIWILSNKNGYWIGPTVTIVLASFAITIAYFEKCWSDDTWSELANLSKLSRAINGLNFGGDITVTFATVCLLRHSKSGVRRTDALMNRLIKFCMKTGLLTTICAVLSLISISIWPTTFVYITFYCILARLYANSFLATLNARESLRKGKRTSKNSDITLSAIRWARDMDSPAARDYSKAALPISIQQEVHVSRDIEMGGSESSNPAEASSYTG